MPRYMLTIEYDGTDFAGWQKQEPYADAVEEGARVEGRFQREGESRERVQLRTVQQVVERAVREVVREPVVLMGASRTDSGVHARGQVGAFTCGGGSEEDSKTVEQRHRDTEPRGGGWPLSRGPDRLLRAVNGRLPDDVQVTACRAAQPGFDPIRDAIEKAYSYTLHVSPSPPAGDGLRPLWDRRHVHQVREPLDAERMAAAAQAFVGEHDFAAFAAAGHGRLSTVRTVTACSAAAVGQRIRIDIAGNGFLWNMVRIIAGTLVHVGRGRIEPGDIPAIIGSGDRSKAGPTLPPTGLCLEWIRYE